MDCRVTPGMTKIDIHSRGAITPESCRTTTTTKKKGTERR